jgi:Fe-S cluster assembly protein SufD
MNVCLLSSAGLLNQNTKQLLIHISIKYKWEEKFNIFEYGFRNEGAYINIPKSKVADRPIEINVFLYRKRSRAFSTTSQQ